MALPQVTADAISPNATEGDGNLLGYLGAAGRKEFQMATEQLHVVVGESYWGTTCPECGEMAPHSKGDSEKPAEAQVTVTCPNGHRFSAQTENLLKFEWGAQ